MILEIVNLLVLVICLFIIGEIIKNLQTRKKKSIQSILFLHSAAFLKGLRMIFLGITLWAFKEAIFLMEKLTALEINLGAFLGIIAAVVLSYGLFLIVFPIRKVFWKEK